MKIINWQGDLTNISAKNEALAADIDFHLAYISVRSFYYSASLLKSVLENRLYGPMPSYADYFVLSVPKLLTSE